MKLPGTIEELVKVVIRLGNNFKVTILGGAQTGNRTFTLPVVPTDDTIMTNTSEATVTNKTISATTNTLPLTNAEFVSLNGVTGSVQNRISNLEAAIGGVSTPRDSVEFSGSSYTFTSLLPEFTVCLSYDGNVTVNLDAVPIKNWIRRVVAPKAEPQKVITINATGGKLFYDGGTDVLLKVGGTVAFMYNGTRWELI